MSVLQHQPHALTQCIIEQIHCRLLLSLAQGYMTEIAHATNDDFRELKQIICGIRAGTEYEAHGYHAGGLLINTCKVNNRRHYEELIHGLDNILIDATEYAIHTETAKEQQFLWEVIQLKTLKYVHNDSEASH